MARQATCLKTKGGCGRVFDTASKTGKLPERCPECKANGKAAASAPREAKAPKASKAPKAPKAKREPKHARIQRTPNEGAVFGGIDLGPLTPTAPRTAAAPMFLVRLGRLEIECLTPEGLEHLVSRFGGVSPA